MREILFRGKTEEGKWFEGDLFRNIRRDYIRDYIRFKSPDDPFEMNYERKQVIHETVGQYTGLTDKNGKKIFEGDIIKQEYTLNWGERAVISVIEYDISYAYTNVCGVCQRFRDGSGTAMLSVGNESGTVYCEIIGNIHDNPELMKGGE